MLDATVNNLGISRSVAKRTWEYCSSHSHLRDQLPVHRQYPSVRDNIRSALQSRTSCQGHLVTREKFSKEGALDTDTSRKVKIICLAN